MGHNWKRLLARVIVSHLEPQHLEYTKAGVLQVGGQPRLHSEFQVNLNSLSQKEKVYRRKKRWKARRRKRERRGGRRGGENSDVSVYNMISCRKRF